MRLFRYPEDRLPVLLIVGLSLADLTLFFLSDNRWLITGWVLIGLAPKACICAWNHHHQHVATFRYVILNRALEIIYALHTGITTNAWVLHHVLGHHLNYLDQDKDESGWRRSDGRTMGTLEYTLTIAVTGYPRAWQLANRHTRYRTAFLGMGALTLVLLITLLYVNTFNTICLFLIPMVVGYVSTCWHTYYHHAGLNTSNHHEASYNIVHKWYNILTGNLGYHTAHHMKAGLHWSKLPAYHEEIAGSIPPNLYRVPCFPFRWMPAH